MRVVSDQVGNPTWSEDLARALVALVGAEARGTFHACGTGAASRFELAHEIIRAADLKATIMPIPTPQTPGKARRPHRAILSTRKLEDTIVYRFPGWRGSIRAYVNSL